MFINFRLIRFFVRWEIFLCYLFTIQFDSEPKKPHQHLHESHRHCLHSFAHPKIVGGRPLDPHCLPLPFPVFFSSLFTAIRCKNLPVCPCVIIQKKSQQPAAAATQLHDDGGRNIIQQQEHYTSSSSSNIHETRSRLFVLLARPGTKLFDSVVFVWDFRFGLRWRIHLEMVSFSVINAKF